MSDEQNIKALRANGWNNCPATLCGFFYKQSKLDRCPACRHEWRKKPGYTQPPYEPPSL